MADKFTEVQISQIKEAFDFFDKDGDGTINAIELGVVMRMLNKNPSESEIESLQGEVYNKGNGTISFAQFLDLMIRYDDFTKESLIDAFRVFDKEGNGNLPVAQLRFLLFNLGEKLTNQEIDEILQEVEIDADGLVNYEDLCNLIALRRL